MVPLPQLEYTVCQRVVVPMVKVVTYAGSEALGKEAMSAGIEGIAVGIG